MAKETIVFTNGCFDILHIGHVRLLERARLMGDTLIVGLNSDRSFKAAKGRSPITPQDQRAEILEAIWAVDEVILFDEPTPIELIKEIRPDILVKGADWNSEDVVGKEYAGRVETIDTDCDIHTSKIIERIRSEISQR